MHLHLRLYRGSARAGQDGCELLDSHFPGFQIHQIHGPIVAQRATNATPPPPASSLHAQRDMASNGGSPSPSAGRAVPAARPASSGARASTVAAARLLSAPVAGTFGAAREAVCNNHDHGLGSLVSQASDNPAHLGTFDREVLKDSDAVAAPMAVSSMSVAPSPQPLKHAPALDDDLPQLVSIEKVPLDNILRALVANGNPDAPSPAKVTAANPQSPAPKPAAAAAPVDAPATAPKSAAAAQQATGRRAEEFTQDVTLLSPQFFPLIHSAVAKIQDLCSASETFEKSAGSKALVYQCVLDVVTRMNEIFLLTQHLGALLLDNRPAPEVEKAYDKLLKLTVVNKPLAETDVDVGSRVSHGRRQTHDALCGRCPQLARQGFAKLKSLAAGEKGKCEVLERRLRELDANFCAVQNEIKAHAAGETSMLQELDAGNKRAAKLETRLAELDANTKALKRRADELKPNLSELSKLKKIDFKARREGILRKKNEQLAALASVRKEVQKHQATAKAMRAEEDALKAVLTGGGGGYNKISPKKAATKSALLAPPAFSSAQPPAPPPPMLAPPHEPCAPELEYWPVDTAKYVPAVRPSIQPPPGLGMPARTFAPSTVIAGTVCEFCGSQASFALMDCLHYMCANCLTELVRSASAKCPVCDEDVNDARGPRADGSTAVGRFKRTPGRPVELEWVH
jgi:hypothetical protein